MKTLLTGGTVLTNKGFEQTNIFICNDRVFAIEKTGSKWTADGINRVIPCDNFFIVPGFVDAHVHLREPGQSYKETVRSGTASAARGGYTTVMSMPNVIPPPVDRETLNKQLEIIRKDAVVKVIPYGAITSEQSGRGELSKMNEMADSVIAFTDDGKGIQSKGLMREAMKKAKSLGKTIVAHCEDESYNTYNKMSEWKQVERDLELVKETGCSYHICHVSTLETVELVKQAKEDGLPVTCETAPHYLLLDDERIRDEGKFKMNPPIRGGKDRQALLQGIQDGTVDMIATDHAPHSREEKQGGFAQSLFGIVGLETAFPVLYTGLVQKKILSLEKLVELMSNAPRRIFDLKNSEEAKSLGIFPEQKADLTVLNLEDEYVIDVNDFLSKGRSTPFEGCKVSGRVVMTWVDGKPVWSMDERIKGK